MDLIRTTLLTPDAMRQMVTLLQLEVVQAGCRRRQFGAYGLGLEGDPLGRS